MSFWEEVKERASIDEVVSEYVELKQSGSNLTCLCPFHQEKTPSMIVSPDKQIFHCFGCGAGGDVIEFVSKIENITSFESAQKLAKKYGVNIPEKKKLSPEKEKENLENTTKNQKGLKLLKWVADVYHQVLLKVLEDRSHPITQYCLQRNLSLEIIKTFGLGYAPKNNFIQKLAQKHNLPLDLLTEAGVLKKTNFGETKDKFSDRLMIPVSDVFGNVVGFTGRVFPYDKTERPKYLNSPASEWFDKSKIWFGWHLHKKDILQQKKVIIVEGNMDVIASHNKNLPYSLASQGTAFNTKQLEFLKRLTQNIELAFDNDNAGLLAGKKFFKEASKLGFVVNKVKIPPPHKDLDDFLNSPDFHGKYDSVAFLDYILENLSFNLTSSDSQLQKQAILEFLELLKNLDQISKEQYLNKLSEITNISPSTLQNFLPNTKKNKIEKKIEKDEKKYLEPNFIPTFQEILSLALFFEDFENFADLETLQKLFSLIQKTTNQMPKDIVLEEYIAQKSSELELIFQNLENKNYDDHLISLFKKTDEMLGLKMAFILINEEIEELFLSYKTSLKI